MPNPVHLEKDYEELFTNLHASGLWSDGKVISDVVADRNPAEILAEYRTQKSESGFDLRAFFETNFRPAPSQAKDYQSDPSQPVEQHIENLWEVLTRQPENVEYHSSLIPMPYPYIVPGGRFNEIYYWDSYFTMLGLLESGRADMVESMLDNFAWLISEYGFIPNGNRTYYLGRSQPPFFSLMVRLLAEESGTDKLVKYLPALENEYLFWMAGSDELSEKQPANRRSVLLPGGQLLNRHYDDNQSPRAEMYQDDIELIKSKGEEGRQTLLAIRAACESGWDFSSRWCKDPASLETIRTHELVTVDLNCLLYHLESLLAEVFEQLDEPERHQIYSGLANSRKESINHFFWNEDTGFYHDYDFISHKQTHSITAAAVFPLYFQICSEEQAKGAAATVKKELLKDGGLLTTSFESGQQWDAPNGWAPLQWMAIQGLRNYGFHQLANTIKERWVALNVKVFKNTGKLMEKYNVADTDLLSGGGEYPVQDGFGWTNGVLLKLLNEK